MCLGKACVTDDLNIPTEFGGALETEGTVLKPHFISKFMVLKFFDR